MSYHRRSEHPIGRLNIYDLALISFEDSIVKCNKAFLYRQLGRSKHDKNIVYSDRDQTLLKQPFTYRCNKHFGELNTHKEIYLKETEKPVLV